MTKELFEVRVLGSTKAVAALDSPQLLYLLVGIRPPSESRVEHQPLNLCLVIDRSTSMKDKLEPVRAAMTMILRQLGAQDLFSAVTFSDRAEVIIPLTRGQADAKAASMFKHFNASGGTEIYQGLKAGLDEMGRADMANHANHLILLTDGHTYGDVRDCLRIARDAALKGIGISAFGIGANWNDRFLDQLVALSGGESAYIESPKQVVGLLKKRLKGLGRIYAQNMHLSLDFPPEAELKGAFKVAPYSQPLSLEAVDIHIGTVEGQAPLAVLLEINLNTPQVGKRIDLPIKLVADVPSQRAIGRELHRQYKIDVRENPPEPNPPKVLLEAVRAYNFQRMNENINDDVKAGRIQSATTRLGHLGQRLLEAGQRGLAEQVRSETRKLESEGALSPEGIKRLKYGTRSLATQVLKPANFDDDHM